MSADDGGSLGEAAAIAALGGVCGVAVGAPIGLAVPFGAIAGANGAIGGWRRIYDWSRSEGVVAFVLDSTWALPMTGAGLLTHAVAFLQRDAGYAVELSRRSNRHVYRRGFQPRRGFAITIGNVVNGAGDISRSGRQQLVTDHEDVHVWQARWFGPLYPLLYGGWMIVGGAVGVVVWAVQPRQAPLAKVVETCAYYVNPFEWWAYSRHGLWPPSGKVVGLGWRFPITRPLRPQAPLTHTAPE
jgi:hypothetical protein